MTRIDAILFRPRGITTDDSGALYEDAVPALAELTALGITLIEVESISEDELKKAVAGAALVPDRVICLTDSEQGIRAARAAGLHPVLMMNDPDEAMRLTALNPAGGVVSLLELPDFIRFVDEQRAGKP